VVLLDRCLEPYPRRSNYDLVGIDNRRTAYLATEHLINAGAKRIIFFARPDSAPTVDARIAGYHEAIQSLSQQVGTDLAVVGDASDAKLMKALLKKHRPDSFVCGNDHTAGVLMHTLMELGLRVPDDLRIVGIDDVRYARLLPVPLTTQHQPCRDIGRVALAVMLERIANPDLPTRDVLLGCKLIVRRSCGTRPAHSK
jgi:DNA-binding LacI/PurR family transcriptional regulator